MGRRRRFWAEEEVPSGRRRRRFGAEEEVRAEGGDRTWGGRFWAGAGGLGGKEEVRDRRRRRSGVAGKRWSGKNGTSEL